MSKKLLNKVISAILVLAICSTAFLGGVVSAETTPNSGTYTIVGAAYSEATDEVKAEVTIASDVPFVAGIFEVTVADNALKFSGVSTDATKGVLDDGTEVDTPYLYTNTTANNKVLFQGFNDELTKCDEYKSITIELTFVATGLEAGEKYSINIDKVDVTDLNEATYNITGGSGYIHIHKYSEVTEDGKPAVKTEKCNVCGDEIYSLVEDSSDITDIPETSTLADEGVGGYAVSFLDNGDLALTYTTTGTTVNTVYLAKLDENDIVIELTDSDGAMPNEEMGFVNIYDKGVKAIGDKVKAVYVEVDAKGDVVSKSKEMNYSIADWCMAVIDNENEYTDAQVGYATALLSYGVEANEYFGYNSKELAAVDAKYLNDYKDLELNSDLVADDKGEGWKFSSATIIMTAKPAVRLAFTIDDEIKDTLKLNVSYPGGSDTVYGTDAMTYENGKYYLIVDDIATKYARENITITAVDEDGQQDGETIGVYSMETYAKRMADKNSVTADIARLLVAYGDALAKAFPGTAQQ